MVSAEILNLIGFVISVVTGSVGAFCIEYVIRLDPVADPDEDREVSTSEKKNAKEISINMAVLYATIAIVISSVVSNWPPEGPKFPSIVEPTIFFLGVAAAAFILVRVMIILGKIEMAGITGDF